MNTYTVTIGLTKEQLLEFLDRVPPGATLDVKVSQGSGAEPAALQRVRKSKVNDALMKAFENGPQTPTQLKNALEGAGLSPGSLSTGLAMLQKAGTVQRVGDGLYELKQAA